MKIGIAILVVLSLSVPSAFGQVKASPERMEARIQSLGKFGANPEGGVSRVAYSEADIAGRAYVMDLMKKAGLSVRIDAAGNIIGKRNGKDDTKPAIAFGSHIDSVPGGGNYDGDVGSLGALEVIELLNENKITTTHPLELYIFQNEEGGLIGSSAVSGRLEKAELELISNSGKTIRQGTKDIGGSPDKLQSAERKKGDFKAFVELHIEQGGTLEKERLEIGVVEGIVAIKQWLVTLEGKANHAGTTPMDQRQDAMLAAAKLTVAVNEVVNGMEGRQVGTVGKIRAYPGAPNVIPGKVEITIEIRDLDFQKVLKVFDQIRSRGQQISEASDVTISYESINEDLPATADPRIQKLIEASAKDLKLTYKYMPSGAGHDSQDIANIAPIGMIFVPSRGGISHSPKEYTSPQDMANGASVLYHTILKLDKTQF